MARQATIIVLGDPTPAGDRLVEDLKQAAFDVTRLARPAERPADRPPPDLVLIDASAGGACRVVDAVGGCRQVWPPHETAVLVFGSTDPALSAAAIEAGATDSIGDASVGPVLAAHVRRVLRAGDVLRSLLDGERRRAKRESLALAAADVAVPLGQMLDELEWVMANAPVDKRLDELLELTGRAVDAVDRLRQLATAADMPDTADAAGPLPDGERL